MRAAGLRNHLIVFTDNIHPFRTSNLTLFHHQEIISLSALMARFWLRGKLRINHYLCNIALIIECDYA